MVKIKRKTHNRRNKSGKKTLKNKKNKNRNGITKTMKTGGGNQNKDSIFLIKLILENAGSVSNISSKIIKSKVEPVDKEDKAKYVPYYQILFNIVNQKDTTYDNNLKNEKYSKTLNKLFPTQEEIHDIYEFILSDRQKQANNKAAKEAEAKAKAEQEKKEQQQKGGTVSPKVQEIMNKLISKNQNPKDVGYKYLEELKKAAAARKKAEVDAKLAKLIDVRKPVDELTDNDITAIINLIIVFIKVRVSFKLVYIKMFKAYLEHLKTSIDNIAKINFSGKDESYKQQQLLKKKSYEGKLNSYIGIKEFDYKYYQDVIKTLGKAIDNYKNLHSSNYLSYELKFTDEDTELTCENKIFSLKSDSIENKYAKHTFPKIFKGITEDELRKIFYYNIKKFENNTKFDLSLSSPSNLYSIINKPNTNNNIDELKSFNNILDNKLQI